MTKKKTATEMTDGLTAEQAGVAKGDVIITFSDGKSYLYTADVLASIRDKARFLRESRADVLPHLITTDKTSN